MITNYIVILISLLNKTFIRTSFYVLMMRVEKDFGEYQLL